MSCVCLSVCLIPIMPPQCVFLSLLLVFFYIYFNHPFCVALLNRMRYIGIVLSVGPTVRPFGGPSVGSSRKLNVRIRIS